MKWLGALLVALLLALLVWLLLRPVEKSGPPPASPAAEQPAAEQPIADTPPPATAPASPRPTATPRPAAMPDDLLASLPAGPLQRDLLALPPTVRRAVLQQLADLALPVEDFASLRVAPNGALYYVCELPGPAPQAAPIASFIPPTAEDPSAASVPIGQPPLLHSRAGATRVAYLDFNGHDLTGTTWNTRYEEPVFNFRPYDTDGNPASFSDAEQAAIVRIWERVAEDFAAFDIDVTTEEPATFDLQTARLLITSRIDFAGRAAPEGNVAGGVAFLDIFGQPGAANLSPAFVYFDNLGTEANIAEAASHEFGHNLGLFHDGTTDRAYYPGHGTGDLTWGPIMGVSYGRNVSQWSKGDYFDANNRQDDLQIIATRLGYVPDDAGDTAESAVPFNVDGATLSAVGRIDRTNDADRFTFTAGTGPVSFTATPFRSATGSHGTNLDVRLELYDAQHTLIALADPPATAAANLTANVPAGPYTLRVSGVGSGDPLSSVPTGFTSYGSLGTYRLSGLTVAPTDLPPSFVRAPASSSAVIGTSTNLSAEVTGTPPLTFVWRHAGNIVAGADTATLNLPNLTTADAGTYTLTVTNAFDSITSEPVTLTVVPAAVAPRITAAPVSQTAIAGDPVDFGITVEGTSPFTYQWRRGGVPLPGARSSTLRLPSTTAADAGSYSVVVSNTAGSVVSPAAQLTVHTRPEYLRQPVSAEVAPGHDATFSVEVAGTAPITMRWQHSTDLGATWFDLADGAGVTGVTTATLALENLTLADHNRRFRAVATNAAGSTVSDPALLRVAEFPAVVSIANRSYHTLFLKADGSVFATGFNGAGQLGDGTTFTTTIPVKVATDVQAIATGSGHSVILKRDGSVWGVGANDFGQLGNADTSNHRQWTRIANGMVDIVANVYVTAMIDTQSRLWVCGRNTFGELGIAGIDRVTTPTMIATDVRSVAIGNGHLAVVTHAGDLLLTGDNTKGQLGDGTTTSRSTLQLLDTGVRQAAATYRATLYVKNDHTLWATGENGWAIFGNGTREDSLVPIQVAADVRRVSATFTHTWRRFTDNTVETDGDNQFGQLGNGRTNIRESGVPVGDDLTVFHAGSQNSFWVTSDGTTWAAGRNDHGQLGEGSTLHRTGPVRVFTGTPAAPTAPTGFKASDGTRADAVFLSWNRVIDAAYYEVWRSASGEMADATRLAGDDTGAARPDPTALSGTTYTYWVRAVGADGTGTFSAPDTGYRVVPASAPVFVVQPVSATVDLGSTATWTAEASGNPVPTLQWQTSTDGGTTWTPLAESADAIGVTSTRLTLANIPVAADGLRIRCLATNEFGAVASSVATLTVNLEAHVPVIIEPPVAVTVSEGESATLSVVATGIAPLSYQWRRNTVAINGANAATLELPALALTDGGSYDVVVTNAAGSTTSPPALVTVLGTAFIDRPTRLASSLNTNYTVKVTTSGPWVVTGLPDWLQAIPASGTGSASILFVHQANTTGAIRRATIHINDAPHTVTQLEDDGLNTWTRRNPVAAVTRLVGVVWNGTRYVAVGDDGYVLTSTDGASWDTSQLPNSPDLTDIAWNGSVHVAVGSLGTVYTSPDGLTWTKRSTPTSSHFAGLCWTGTSFYATAGRSVLSSPDGITWTERTSSAPNLLRKIVYGGGGLVAIVQGGTLFTSADGSTWTTVETGLTNSFGSVAYDGQKWLVATGNARMLTSTDRVTWTSHPQSNSAALTGMIWNGERFFSTSSSGRVWSSSDGLDWTRHDLDWSVTSWHALWDGQRFLIVGDSGFLATGTPDATTWTIRGSATANSLNDVIWTGERYVAVGNFGDIVTSPDGFTWSRTTSGTSDSLNAVASTASGFAAVGSNGRYLRSPDGLNWTVADRFTSQHLYNIRWINGLHIAVGRGTALYTSVDGLQWTSRSLGVTSAVSVRDVEWNGNEFLAVGPPGVAFASSDGTTWQQVPIPTASQLVNIVWNGARFVAAGSNRELLSSPDGRNWTKVPFDSNFSFGALCWSGTRFVASSSFGFTYTSLDGIDWVVRSSQPVGTLHGLTTRGDEWIGVGASGTIIGAVDTSRATAPRITLHPQSQTGLRHRSAALTVSAVGTPAPVYQWRRNGASISGANRPSFTIARLDDTTAGSYDVVVSNPNGTVTSQAAEIAVTSPLELWQAQHFSTSEQADPSISGAEADPDRDGFTNLAEYALGLDPVAPDPAFVGELSADSDHWNYAFALVAEHTDVEVVAETSFDLHTWTTDGVSQHLIDTQNGFDTWVATVTRGDESRIFFRLRITTR